MTSSPDGAAGERRNADGASDPAVEDDVERPISVFVAEDEAIIRLDLVETLTSMGFDVVGQSGRGDETEARIRELQPDVAILDIQMPGRSGLDIARSLANDLTCAVVILSAFSQRALVEEAVAAGVLAYLLKPYQRHELSVQIEVARGRHQQMSELAAEVQQLNRRLADRIVLDRAKGLLIDSFAMGEAEAMRFVQKRAMDERRPVRDIAAAVLDGTVTPTSARYPAP